VITATPALYVYNNLWYAINDLPALSKHVEASGAHYEGDVFYQPAAAGMPLFQDFGTSAIDDYTDLASYLAVPGTTWERNALQVDPGLSLSAIDADPYSTQNAAWAVYQPTNQSLWGLGVPYASLGWPGTSGVDYRGALAPPTLPPPPTPLPSPTPTPSGSGSSGSSGSGSHHSSTTGLPSGPEASPTPSPSSSESPSPSPKATSPLGSTPAEASNGKEDTTASSTPTLAWIGFGLIGLLAIGFGAWALWRRSRRSAQAGPPHNLLTIAPSIPSPTPTNSNGFMPAPGPTSAPPPPGSGADVWHA
jgi:hypothetical protein